MGTKILFLALLIFLSSYSEANQKPTVILTFGIYRAFTEDYSLIPEKDILGLIKQSQDIINQEIFGWPAFEFEIIFIEKWPFGALPIYQDKYIPLALDADELFISMERRREPGADARLLLTNVHAAAKNSSGAMETKGGLTSGIGGNKIVIGNFPRQQNIHDVNILLHELGHFLNLDHTAETICGESPFLMCREWNQKTLNEKIIIEESYKNAFQKFYDSRAAKSPK